MPLKVSITVKVEDGNYNTPVEVVHARTVTVPEEGYRDPQPKGYAECRALLEDLNEVAMIDAQNAMDRAHTFDMERVQREQAKLTAEQKRV